MQMAGAKKVHGKHSTAPLTGRHIFIQYICFDKVVCQNGRPAEVRSRPLEKSVSNTVSTGPSPAGTAGKLSFSVHADTSHNSKNESNCLGAPVFRDKIGIFVPTEAKIFDV